VAERFGSPGRPPNFIFPAFHVRAFQIDARGRYFAAERWVWFRLGCTHSGLCRERRKWVEWRQPPEPSGIGLRLAAGGSIFQGGLPHDDA